MSDQDLQKFMKPRQDSRGNYRISKQQMNVMLMAAVGRDIDDIHELAIFDVPRSKEQIFQSRLWDLQKFIQNFKSELYAELGN